MSGAKKHFSLLLSEQPSKSFFFLLFRWFSSVLISLESLLVCFYCPLIIVTVVIMMCARIAPFKFQYPVVNIHRAFIHHPTKSFKAESNQQLCVLFDLYLAKNIFPISLSFHAEALSLRLGEMDLEAALNGIITCELCISISIKSFSRLQPNMLRLNVPATL